MAYWATVIVLLCSSFILTTAQECPLPTNGEIESALNTLLQNSDGTQTYDPQIMGSVHYACQAQGPMRDRYRTVSIIATYTPNTGEPQATSIFQLICNTGPVWVGDTNGGLPDPPASVVNATTRIDCIQCVDPGSVMGVGDDRCRECSGFGCTQGSGRCYNDNGNAVCCPLVTSTGQCASDCTSDGVNYVANSANNYVCSCNITCSPGHTVNSNCTACDFTNICERDTPCINGGTCILTSAPDQYTCNCGPGYTGVNCEVLIPSSSPSPSPTPSPSPSPVICNLDGCQSCEVSDCCATCSIDYTILNGGCSCGTVSTSSSPVVVPSCTVDGCSNCVTSMYDCCDTCLEGYSEVGTCSCSLTPMTSSEMRPSPTETATSTTATGIPSGTLIGLILGVIFGILLILTLSAVVAYLIYYFAAGAGSGTNKTKSKSPFANGESHNNPLYLAPDEVSPL